MRVLSKWLGKHLPAVAMLFAVAGATVGCGNSGSSNSSGNATAAPIFTPGAGTYNTSQTVTVSSTTPGAVMYCTIDGTMPTISSPQCSQPVTVFKSETLQAIAVAPNKSASAVTSAGYTINLNAAATPSFSPNGGSYIGTQQVTISDATAGANIYYTLDGSTPGPNSTLYTGPVSISKSATLTAIAIASGYANSGLRSATYTIQVGPSAPVISPAGGTFTSIPTVAITDATPGASIYYTTNGSTPTTSSTPYTGTFSVGASGTVSAIAVLNGVSSTVTSASFTINLPAAAAPTFNPSAGSYPSAQQILLNDATTGATIFYTVDGSVPSTSSTQYNGTPINVASNETIKAIATAPGFSQSTQASAAYTIAVSVPQPTFSPAAGTYNAAVSVTLSDTDANASIYYTLDGSTPSASSTKYTAPITVDSSKTVSAIAVDAGTSSSVATAAYTIDLLPTFTGKVMSGTLPVIGATVNMYAAGNTGYASAAALLTTTAGTSGSDGSFSLSYNCPAAGGDLVYVIATGGHTGSNAPNSALSFMAALGSCNSALPSPLVVNEVTSVASAYSLSQFMSDATHVGATSTNYQASGTNLPGLSNAFATVNNLVDLASGQARDHTPTYPTNLAGDTNILNNSTVPQARINALADDLNLCAADGSGCSTLFSAATPQGGSTPSDTLQSILNIAQHPGNNASIVFNVAAGAGPFTPALSAAPNDWTLAITYTGGGLGFARSAPIKSLLGSQGTGTAFTNGVFENTSLAIDATGTLWVTGFTVRGSNSSLAQYYDVFSGMVAKFDNLGNPLTPASSLAADGTTPTYGGFVAINQLNGSGGVDNSGTISPRAIAIDTLGNAWVTGGSRFSLISSSVGAFQGAAMTEITPGSPLSLAIPWIYIGATPGNAPIAIDGSNGVWTFNTTLQKFESSGTQDISNDGTTTPGYSAGYTTTNFGVLAFDSQAASLWASGTTGAFFQIKPADGSGIVNYTNSDGVFTSIVADKLGNVYGCRLTGGQELDVFNASSTSTIANYSITTGRGCGHQMVMDGAGHLFAITGSPGSTITPGIIDEFSVTSSGITLISPLSSGYTGTGGNGESPTINGDPAAPRFPGSSNPPIKGGIAGAAIDGSGNLWILNADTGTTASPGNVLVKFVGIAAPVVTPTSLALQYGEVGVRP